MTSALAALLVLLLFPLVLLLWLSESPQQRAKRMRVPRATPMPDADELWAKASQVASPIVNRRRNLRHRKASSIFQQSRHQRNQTSLDYADPNASHRLDAVSGQYSLRRSPSTLGSARDAAYLTSRRVEAFA